MIKNLKIKNFAIIKDLNIDFENNLTMLIGETGAGKSLIVDAIEYLLYKKTNVKDIKIGAEYAEITGVFTLKNQLLVIKRLKHLNIEVNDELIIKRIIKSNNKTVIYLNDSIVTLSTLKTIASELCDINSQFQASNMLDKKNHFGIVHDLLFTQDPDYLKIYSEKLNLYKQYISELENYKNMTIDVEYLNFQIETLEALNIQDDEENIIENKIKSLNSKQDTIIKLDELQSIFSSDLMKNIKKLDEIKIFFEKIGFKHEIDFMDIYYKIEDFEFEISKLTEENEEVEDINYLENRIFEIQKFKRKYNCQSNDLIIKLQEFKKLLDDFNNIELIILELEKKIKILHEQILEIAENISLKRQEITKTISQNINVHLNDLGLKNAVILYDFKKSPSFLETGIDIIEILFKNNNSDFLPLVAIASGGELSRIMLALKIVVANISPKGSIIFDEIDNGVSGEIAHKIATKLKKLGNNIQVIVISHLPQTVAIGKHHLYIYKDNELDNVFSSYLQKNEVIEFVAKMISNGKVSENTLIHAENLIKNE